MNSHIDRQRDRRNTPPGVRRPNRKTTASGHSAGANRYRLQRTGALCPLQEGRGCLPTTPTGDPLASLPESYTGLRKQALSETAEKTYRLQVTLWIGLPGKPMGDPGRAPKCYAQVAKSPNDHQGGSIRRKSKRVFIIKLELGLPPLLTQRLRRGAPSFGLHCLYREYSGERVTKAVFRLKDY